jgi:hypothetical protein
VRSAVALAVAAATLAACSDLQGFGGPTPPLVTFNLVVNGDPTQVLPPGVTDVRSLQVALVWGAQWLTEPFCVLPPESDPAAAVIAAGCRDPFGFVPNLVGANVPVTPGVPTTMSLFDLPSPDVMVGDVTSRVGYGSFVVYDDRDGDGTLGLSEPQRTPSGGDRGDMGQIAPDSLDVVYGASFVTMTAKDQRVSFLEGTFDTTSAFYPRAGCDPPFPSFSILGAPGFSAAAGLASAATGQLPLEDPTTSCTRAKPGDAPGDPNAVVTIDVASPASVQEVSCVERANDSSTRYRQPPLDQPDFTGRTTACAHLPAFDAGDQSSLLQFVVSGRLGDRCLGLTHYTLRGCRENVSCTVPDWDFTANPPAWWPPSCTQ